MGFVDVRIYGHRAGAEEAETSSAEIGDFDTFEGDDRFGHDVEGCGRAAPDCESDGEVRVVDERQLSLVVRFTCRLGDNLRGLSNFFKDAYRVDRRVLLDRLQIADACEVEADLRNPVLLFCLLHHCVLFKREFVVVIQVFELLLCHLDPAGTCDVVDSALLENLVQHIALVVEPCTTDLATFIKQVDAEQPAFSVFVVPRFNVGLVGTARLDRPFVGVR